MLTNTYDAHCSWYHTRGSDWHKLRSCENYSGTKDVAELDLELLLVTELALEQMPKDW